MNTVYESTIKEVQQDECVVHVFEPRSLHSSTGIRDPHQLKNELSIGVLPQTRTDNCMDEDVVGLNGINSAFIAKHIDVDDLQNLKRLAEMRDKNVADPSTNIDPQIEVNNE